MDTVLILLGSRLPTGRAGRVCLAGAEGHRAEADLRGIDDLLFCGGGGLRVLPPENFIPNERHRNRHQRRN